MKLEDIKTIVVIGAGVMGRGIAMVCAQAGYRTLMYDLKQEILESAEAYAADFWARSVEKGKMTAAEREQALDRLHFSHDKYGLQGELVIEAILERLDLKQQVFQQVADLNPPTTILASNTSTLPITQIAAGVPHPERVVGMHFFNPAPLMRLVEVISGEMTDPAVAQLTLDLARKLGKQPVHAQDEPGFIVNRVARQFYVESLRALEERAADHETIDRLMHNYGFRMGPFELMDLIGIETNHEVTRSMFKAFFFEEKFRPSRIQQKKVDAGHWGRKSGRGFYRYDKP